MQSLVLHSIRSEFLKLKRSPLFIAVIALPVLSTILGTLNFQANRGILQHEWISLWSQFSLFMCYLFFPSLIAAFASYLWRLERAANAETEFFLMPRPLWLLVISKFIVCSFLIICSLAVLFICYFIVGNFLNFNSAFPLMQCLLYFVLGSIAAFPLILFHLVLSYKISNFAIPVGIGFLGGLLGLVITSAGFGQVFLYSLMQMGMNSNTLVDLSMKNIIQLLLVCLAYLLVLYKGATIIIRK